MPISRHEEACGRQGARGILRAGFTLIEMLIVIGVIGLLIAVAVAMAPGFMASGRDTTCKANLRNLANAFLQAANSEGGYFPVAGSYQYTTTYRNSSTGEPGYKANEKKGWISWAAKKNAYPKFAREYNAVRTAPLNAGWHTSFAAGDTALYCVTNGTLWKYTGKNLSAYVCPEHKREFENESPGDRHGPLWSYMMNAFFKSDTSMGECAVANYTGKFGKKRSETARLNKILLFAEIQALPASETGLPERDFGKGSGNWRTDCTLQYKGLAKNWSGSGEIVGFNHKHGSLFHANVAYADAHVDEIELPARIDRKNLEEMTAWLCTGTDFSLDGETFKQTK